jgi:hypothetical protein
MALIDLIGGNNFIPVSRKLCSAIGPAEAVLYCELVDQYRFWEKCGKLDDEGMFFSTVDQIQSKIGLSKDQQPRYLKKLSSLGLIKVVRKGIPAKRFIKVFDNPQFLKDLYAENLDKARNIQKSQNAITCNRKTRQQEIAKCDDKKSQNPAVTNLYITNLNNNNGVVDFVSIFSEQGIDIKPVIRKNPEVFSSFTEKEIRLIAETLAKKQSEGKILNPVGMLLSDPRAVAGAILAGKFYPNKKKTTTTYTQEYEIYVPPRT